MAFDFSFYNPLTLTILCVLTLNGCLTTRAYDGPARSSSEVSRVKIHGGNFIRVNGISIGDSTSEVEVLAGRNVVELAVSATNFQARNEGEPVLKLALIAKPATNYIITGQRGDGRLCAWPVQEDTGDPDFSSPSGCVYRD